MDLNYLRKITKIFTESGVDEIEIEEEGLKLRIAKSKYNSVANLPVPQQVIQTIPTPQIEHKPLEIIQEVKPAVPQVKLHEVKSPIVGTFYRAPSPDADSYVEVGHTIQKGTVLCIIEAMKLMNEIESDMSGRIVKIIAENAQAVEYNQVLFLIEPT